VHERRHDAFIPGTGRPQAERAAGHRRAQADPAHHLTGSRLALTGGAAVPVPCRQRPLLRTLADDGYAGERGATATLIAVEIVRKRVGH